MSDVKIRPIYRHDTETGHEELWYEARFKGIRTDGYTVDHALKNLDTIMRSMFMGWTKSLLKEQRISLIQP